MDAQGLGAEDLTPKQSEADHLSSQSSDSKVPTETHARHPLDISLGHRTVPQVPINLRIHVGEA